MPPRHTHICTHTHTLNQLHIPTNAALANKCLPDTHTDTHTYAHTHTHTHTHTEQLHIPTNASANNLIDVSARKQKCCNMGQNDTIGKIELNPSFVLSSDETNCKNDIQLFHQLFDELSVNRDYH